MTKVSPCCAAGGNERIYSICKFFFVFLVCLLYRGHITPLPCFLFHMLFFVLFTTVKNGLLNGVDKFCLLQRETIQLFYQMSANNIILYIFYACLALNTVWLYRNQFCGIFVYIITHCFYLPLYLFDILSLKKSPISHMSFNHGASSLWSITRRLV